jgi:hypothetical protein
MVVGVYGHLQQFFSYILYIVTDGVKAWREITNWLMKPSVSGRCHENLNTWSKYRVHEPTSVLLCLWSKANNLDHLSTLTDEIIIIIDIH